MIFAAPNAAGEIGKLRDLRDPRVWIIGGDGPEEDKPHYFETFVNSLMPEQPTDRIDTAVRKVVQELIDPRRKQGNEEAPGAG